MVQDEVKRLCTSIGHTCRNPTMTTIYHCNQETKSSCPQVINAAKKTDLWRGADNRPVCFHCARPEHVVCYCRERKAVFVNYRNRRQDFEEIDTEEETRRPNFIRRSTPRPTRGRSPTYHFRSPSLKEATFQGDEAACDENPPSAAKMTGYQLDVIKDNKPIRTLVDSGASFSVISDKYRQRKYYSLRTQTSL